MKKIMSRKLAGAIICTVILTVAYFVTLGILKTIDTSVTITFMVLIVTNWFMYIGGNVWSSWVKSKYFNPDQEG